MGMGMGHTEERQQADQLGGGGGGGGLRQEKDKIKTGVRVTPTSTRTRIPIAATTSTSETRVQEIKKEEKKEEEEEDKIVPHIHPLSLLANPDPDAILPSRKSKIASDSEGQHTAIRGQQTAEGAAATARPTPKGIQGVTDWIDSNKRSISWALDATIVLGLAIALHSVRAVSTKQFTAVRIFGTK